MQRSHAGLIKFLKRIPDADLKKDFGVRSPRGRVITVAEHLQAEIDDEQTHLTQIKKWVKKTKDE